MDDEPYIDPEMRPILHEICNRQAQRADVTDISVAEMRTRAAEDLAVWNRDGPMIQCVEDWEIPLPGRGLRARTYRPRGDDSPGPTLVYCHGGGWVIGDLDTEDYSLRLLAAKSGCDIVSIDYRLAPEHPYPAAVEDCAGVIRYLQSHGAEHGVDPDRLAVGGASAGAHIAITTALALRDAGDDVLRFCVLFYGAYSPRRDTASHRRFGEGDYFLSSDTMDFFWSCYLGSEAGSTDLRAVPLESEVAGLPPTFLIAAEIDPLRDDTLTLASRLREAGVEVQCEVYPGVLHGFTVMARDLSAAREALTLAGNRLRDRLGSRRLKVSA